jgi:hypothetical protein
MFRIVAVLRLCSSVQSLNRVRAGMGVAPLVYTRMVADTHADYCSLTTPLVRLYIRFTKRALVRSRAVPCGPVRSGPVRCGRVR